MLASGSGSNLQAIIDQVRSASLRVDPVVVISDVQDAYALTRAREAGIAHEVIDPRDFADRGRWSQSLAEALLARRAELIVLAGFMRIVAGNLLDAFPGRVLNIHPSLLPRYRGLDTYRRVLEAGDDFHGTSVHFVTEELDGGPVVAQARIRIGADRDPERLKARVQAAEHWLYPKIIGWFAGGRLRMHEDAAWLDGTRLTNPRVFNEDGSPEPARAETAAEQK